MPNRIPEAETALIGCIIDRPDVWDRLTSRVDDFTDSRCRNVYQAMADVVNSGQPLEYGTVAMALSEKGQESLIADIIDWRENLGSSANWKVYDRTIRELGAKRDIMTLAINLQAMSRNGAATQDIIDIARLKIEEIEHGFIPERRNISGDIKDWVQQSEGVFYVSDIDQELCLKTKQDKLIRRVTIHRMIGKEIQRVNNRQGAYRKIQDELELIDIMSQDAGTDLGLRWPFEIERLCYFYESSVGVVAGAKDSGKTGFLLKFTALNAEKYSGRIFYFNSEMGGPELVNRLDASGINRKWWNYHVKFPGGFTFDNIADKVQRDCINVIDFLEEPEKTWLLGSKIAEIRENVGRGAAIIGLQKDKGKDVARGGEATKQKARIYLLLESGEAELVVAKLWKPGISNPKGTKWNYKLTDGFNFHIY